MSEMELKYLGRSVELLDRIAVAMLLPATVLETGFTTRVERHEVGDHRECTASCPDSGWDKRPTLGIAHDVAAMFHSEVISLTRGIQQANTWSKLERLMGGYQPRNMTLAAARVQHMAALKYVDKIYLAILQED